MVTYQSYESAKANPKCKWCTYLDFAISMKCFCSMWEKPVTKLHHTCKQYSRVDRYTFFLRRYWEKENVRKRQRDWAKENYPRLRTVKLERERKYRLKYKEEHNEYNKKWQKEHPEYFAFRNAIRQYDPLTQIKQRFNYHKRREALA